LTPEINRLHVEHKQTNCQRVLISVVGLAPQVITETLYYYWRVASPSVPITQVFALTTLEGKERLVNTLIGARGQIQALCNDYGLPPICFDEEHILVLKNAYGQPLEDISTVTDNEAAADQIFALVRKLAADPDVCLHASIAGGRKTMSVYLALAMQFYGRPGDTLSHILVNPELERSPQFFYPPSPNQPGVLLGDGTRFPVNQIRLELAEIPLLFMREKIPFLNAHSEASYTALIQIAQQAYDRLQVIHPVVVARAGRSLCIDKATIKLPPLEFALYLYFARKRLSTCATEACPGCETCSVAWPALDALRDILQNEMGIRDPRYGLPKWSGAEAIDRFAQTKSKLNAAIRKGLANSPFARRYQIERLDAFPGWGNARYGIPLDKRLIQIQ
jgi:CRISPR-associated protein (TIGR02584 family)